MLHITKIAAAYSVICNISLEDIYLMATPLHSQNFIDIGDGILTNNRRIVTKNMWFNGTELITKAQRAMRNENITIVSHNTGYIHVVYPEATIDNNRYENFKQKLNEFLVTEINSQVFCNFLRQESQFQKCFQLNSFHNGKEQYIGVEKVYAYEHTSPYRVNDNTRDKLVAEIDEYDFSTEQMEGRISLNKMCDYLDNNKVTFDDEDSINKLLQQIKCTQINKKEIFNSFFEFCSLTPRLPADNKIFIKNEEINIRKGMSRKDIISYLQSIREKNITADLAFYAYRDFSTTSWEPFIKAAIERNPVSIEACKNLSDAEVIQVLENMNIESIYCGPRVAQPDEVWNYQRGDGLEKAICLANIFLNRNENIKIAITIKQDFVEINIEDRKIIWSSNKGLEGVINIPIV